MATLGVEGLIGRAWNSRDEARTCIVALRSDVWATCSDDTVMVCDDAHMSVVSCWCWWFAHSPAVDQHTDQYAIYAEASSIERRQLHGRSISRAETLMFRTYPSFPQSHWFARNRLSQSFARSENQRTKSGGRRGAISWRRRCDPQTETETYRDVQRGTERRTKSDTSSCEAWSSLRLWCTVCFVTLCPPALSAVSPGARTSGPGHCY